MIPIFDLPFPSPPPAGWKWIEAHRCWAGGGRIAAPGEWCSLRVRQGRHGIGKKEFKRKKNVDNKILEVNLAVSQLLGLRRDEVLERRSLASSLPRRQRSSSPLCGKSSSAV
jgi:hypothetical protein